MGNYSLLMSKPPLTEMENKQMDNTCLEHVQIPSPEAQLYNLQSKKNTRHVAILVRHNT